MFGTGKTIAISIFVFSMGLAPSAGNSWWQNLSTSHDPSKVMTTQQSHQADWTWKMDQNKWSHNDNDQNANWRQADSKKDDKRKDQTWDKDQKSDHKTDKRKDDHEMKPENHDWNNQQAAHVDSQHDAHANKEDCDHDKTGEDRQVKSEYKQTEHKKAEYKQASCTSDNRSDDNDEHRDRAHDSDTNKHSGNWTASHNQMKPGRTDEHKSDTSKHETKDKEDCDHSEDMKQAHKDDEQTHNSAPAVLGVAVLVQG